MRKSWFPRPVGGEAEGLAPELGGGAGFRDVQDDCSESEGHGSQGGRFWGVTPQWVWRRREGCTRHWSEGNRCETEEKHACRDDGGRRDGSDGRPARIGRAGSLQWANTATHRQPATFNDVASGAGGTWAVGGDQVEDFTDQRPLAMRWDGKTWKATAQPVKTNATLESVAVGTATDVWAVGEDRTDPEKPSRSPCTGTARSGRSSSRPPYRPDRSTMWSSRRTSRSGSPDGRTSAAPSGPSSTGTPVGSGSRCTPASRRPINGNVLAVLSANNAWLGLNAGLAHFDGKRWTLVKDLPTDGSQIPTGIAAAGPKNIWLVGVRYASGIAPLALHYNGTKWAQVAGPHGHGPAVRRRTPEQTARQPSENASREPTARSRSRSSSN